MKLKSWVKQYLSTLVQIIKKYPYDFYNFGLKIAHYNFRWEFANSGLLPFWLNKTIKQKKNDLIYNFLNTKYENFINEYKTKNITIWLSSKKIWCCWWQWEEQAPELVKICINSTRKHNCWYDVIIITKDNYLDYIKLPDSILRKVDEWLISITHLSDILRMWLLSQYWWIRVDATMYINSNIFSEFDNKPLNSNYPKIYVKTTWWFEKWCWFFIWWQPNKLFNFVFDFFIQYHKDYKYLINYFLIDYVILLAYKNFEECKKDIDWISLHNEEIFTLANKFNEQYDEKEYKKILNHWFFKLTYKWMFYTHTKDWNLTNYWNFLKWLKI